MRRELLLEPGDEWDGLKIQESERNLRSIGSFRKVNISSSAAGGGGLELAVRTQDAWTLNPQFSVGTEGGDHFLIAGIEENNLLGRGKSVSAFHRQFGPRIRNDYRYADPRLWGSRHRFSGLAATNNQGESFGADLALPFFELDAPRAHEIRWFRMLNEEILYQDAEDFSKFTGSYRTLQAEAGRRLPWGGAWTHRAQLGWYYDRSAFYPTIDTRAGTLPSGRELSGPLAGWSWVQPRYIKETNVNTMERDEDYNLGNEMKALAGFAGQGISSDRDAGVYNLSESQGLSLGPGRFALARASASGRISRSRSENQLLSGNLNFVWKIPEPWPQTIVGHAELNLGKNLDGENQVLLGGNTGLRGYKNHSFAGAKSILLNLETRFYFPEVPGEWFRRVNSLFRLGAAVFFDSGAVVPEGSGISPARFKSDIGIGLRAAATRSRRGNVLRVDLAYALNKGPGPDRVVFSVRGGQAFEFFSSATRKTRQSPASSLADTAPPEFPSIR